MVHDPHSRRRFFATSAIGGAGAVGAILATHTAFAETSSRDEPQVFINNVGYESSAQKRAIIGLREQDEASRFVVYETATGRAVHRGPLQPAETVRDWNAREDPSLHPFYCNADFSALRLAGEYILAIYADRADGGSGRAQARSSFRIEEKVLERYTLSHAIQYFKASRCSGQFNKQDHNIPVGPDGTRRVDAHGGWYDATGDFGKHLSQLSATAYFNCGNIPITAWALLSAQQNLVARDDPDFTQLTAWFADEGMFGADYLTRIHPENESFYSSVMQPGTAKDPAERYLDPDKTTHLQVGFRESGGIAIAALALAATFQVSGEYDNAAYLRTAKEAFAYLQENNLSFTNDGKENIVDDYNILLAVTELYKATSQVRYKRLADERATQLSNRLTGDGRYENYWRADDNSRPYYHPSHAGLPAVSLLKYSEIVDQNGRDHILEIVRKSLEFELSVTYEVANPFGYARQLVQDASGRRYSGFFFPHDVAPLPGRYVWWQGENARIASLAAAARLAASHFETNFSDKLRAYANDQLNWILGLNPYRICMLEGSGHNNPQYIWEGSWQFLPRAGGIANGITGRNDDGTGILWNPTPEREDWRWTEQWLPHTAWYTYAVSIGE